MHEDHAHNIQNEEDLSGRKIGFLTDTVTGDAIERAYRLSFQRVDVDNFQMAVRMLESGEIVAFIEEAVSDPAFADYSFIQSAIFFPMLHESVSLTTANPALAPIVSVVSKYIAAGGIDKLYELYQAGDFEYARYKLHRSFTLRERYFLRDLREQETPIYVAFESDNYPVSFWNEADQAFEGIAADVLAEISRLTDLRFVSATTKHTTWAEMFERVRSGEIPMVAQLLPSEARREHFIWSAVPYSRSYYALLSRADFPSLAIYQIARTSVGVMRKSGHADIYRELFPENDNLVEFDSLEASLDALARGEVDLVMGSEHLLLFQTNYRERTDLKVNIKLRAPMNSHFGFNQDQTILRSIIDKAQQFVPVSAIEIDWTGRSFDYSKKLAEDRATNMMIFAGIMGVILLGAVYLLLKTIKLGRQIKETASKDGLTDIFNRRHFMEVGLAHLERALRTGGDSFIIIFDLDHFKRVNDTHGHQAGDEVLRETAKWVKKAVRPYDVLGRYGGEEFIILMADINKEDVLKAAERIRQDVCKEPVAFEGKEIPVSASFGVAFAAPHNDMHAAIKYADEALYQAKAGGRNQVVFYGDGKP